ncbi:14 kDa proline-rich protein DC2.15 [Amborella trichopoda]|nr:14 kDa proline-rich protein DC2.15 [Amborella trichopoda]|eukprot:XP_011627857.1 14 kDa proline-rich protein DC2.15 [Amborella trichopoda]
MGERSVASLALCLSIMFLVSNTASACCGCKKAPPVLYYPPPYAYPSCPKDALKLGVCADLLSGLVNVVIGSPPSGDKCCPLLYGLADLEAAVCLCTAIKANVLGIIKVEVPVALSLLISACQKTIPPGFVCP